MTDALDTIISDLRAYIAQLRAQLAQAEQRAQIVSTAYDQQQSSYRELEALYQAAVERAQLRRAEPSAPSHAESSE